MASAWFSPFSEALLPRQTRNRLFWLDAGILSGVGKMDCWADNQAYRFEVGLTIHNMMLEQQAARVDVDPRRVYHGHAGCLLEWDRAWGTIVRGMYLNNGRSFYQFELTGLYRRHFTVLTGSGWDSLFAIATM